ncbi:hypothetical protein [Flindersiella endophytica]
MPDVIGWYAEQVRKLYDVVPVELHIDAGDDGVHRLTVTEPDAPASTSDELMTRFRARAGGGCDGAGSGLAVTAALTVGPVARVSDLLGTTVIDSDAMRRLADHQLQQAFPATPPPVTLDAIGLFDPAIGQGWVLQIV